MKNEKGILTAMPFFFKGRHQKDNKQESLMSGDKNPETVNVSGFVRPLLAENLSVIKEITGNSADVVIRKLKTGADEKIELAVVYVGGITDEKAIHDFLLESIMSSEELAKKEYGRDVLETIAGDAVALGGVEKEKRLNKMLESLMAGDTIILAEGTETAVITTTKGGEKRSIKEPENQQAFRGSREGFIESLDTNISLVRRIIKNPNLWVEKMTMGSVTKTDVAIMYINGVCDPKTVKEVKKRMAGIEIDSILESGYIEQFIEDAVFTTFPTIYHTERPDMVAGNLLEGRIAIFVDGTPFVLLVPAVFIQFFQSVEDYYSRFDIATFIRFLRVLIFFISLIAPAVYVGATTFHQEMIPTELLIVIAAQREIVPFPAVVEALIMEISFEILREAGIRLPKAIGSAVSIVGAIVIGQAAVQAGIVSPAMVIVVAITAISSFATPSFAMAISARLVRFFFILAAATTGFYGIILGLIIMFVHLCSLRSFGVPYMTPFAPFILKNWGDSIVRLPWWTHEKRPELIGNDNKVRQGEYQKPNPPESGDMKTKQEDGDPNETKP
ncbi:spore germination protein [Bacillus paralicheniformis]|jgi:spore germination protein KA|nr:spore germination protein [Bacillus paralicheniformis]KJD55613.1 spore gernimation protein KB [Bacillus amyloliquefaciens]KUL14699.1 spore germination protein KA [Bacillus licheniformis LMG 7559]ARA84407.1 spore germination protein [Bacillus paralicheniformis]AYQ15015.1 spore germination protein [Bacillus paralicheniformis]KAA0835887.1 spore germination protein [Bacillus paralicheniformis]